MARGGGGGHSGGGHSGGHSSSHGGGYSHHSHSSSSHHSSAHSYNFYHRYRVHTGRDRGRQYVRSERTRLFIGRGAAFSIAVFVLCIILSDFSGTHINFSTVQREPLAKGQESSEWYLDRGNEGGWIKDEDKLLSGMQYFYDKTGVQPYLYILQDIDGNRNPTGQQLEAELEKFYHSKIQGENRLLVGFLEGVTNEYVTACFAGDDALSVMDPQAREILLDYLDRYYTHTNLTDDEYFSVCFQKTADKIMAKPSVFAPLASHIPELIIAAFTFLTVFVVWLAFRTAHRENEKISRGTYHPLTEDEQKRFDEGQAVIINGAVCDRNGRPFEHRVTPGNIAGIVILWGLLPGIIFLVGYMDTIGSEVSPAPGPLPSYAKLSADPFTVGLGGKTITLPCTLAEVEKKGLTVDVYPGTVDAGLGTSATIDGTGDNVVTLSVKNESGETKPAEECTVIGIRCQADRSADDFGIQAPGDIRMLVSTGDDVTKVFGKEKSRSGTQIRYVPADDWTLTFDIDPAYGIADGFSLERDYLQTSRTRRQYEKIMQQTQEASQQTAAEAEEAAEQSTAEQSASVQSTEEQSTPGRALERANRYLSSGYYSRNGLIDQLLNEEFTQKDAVYAVEHCGADWNEQAVLKAKWYLKGYGYSYKGLVNQLKYDQFTDDQAAYAAIHCGANWKEQAVKMAREYLSHASFDKGELISQLEYDGFTQEEAEYAAEKCIQ